MGNLWKCIEKASQHMGAAERRRMPENWPSKHQLTWVNLSIFAKIQSQFCKNWSPFGALRGLPENAGERRRMPENAGERWSHWWLLSASWVDQVTQTRFFEIFCELESLNCGIQRGSAAKAQPTKFKCNYSKMPIDATYAANWVRIH